MSAVRNYTMLVFNYLQNRELGKSIGKSKPNIDFVLNRFQCFDDDFFKIPSNQEASTVPPFQSRFCPVSGQEHIYSLASEEGNVLILNSNRCSSQSLLKEWTAHDNAIFDTCWVDENKIITASGDKTAVLWDVKSNEKLVTCKGHGCSLKSIALKPSNYSIFATGARDGNIMLWDIRCHDSGVTRPINLITEAHATSSIQNTGKQRKKRVLQSASRIINPMNSITSVLFQDDNILLSTGSSDRTIKGWDLRFISKANMNKTSLIPITVSYPGSCVRSHGYTNLTLHPNGSSFFANCTDGVIYRYSCSESMPRLVSTYYGHKVNSFFVKMDLSGDGDYILSGSSDHKAYIWNVSNPGPPILKLSGHDAEVTAVAWCPSDITKIITCSDDDRVLQWQLGHHLEKKSKENSNNAILGQALPIDLKAISCPLQVANCAISSTPKQITTPKSSQMSPVTPSTSLKRPLSSPSLRQWFTPKRAHLTPNNSQLTPPTTPESCLSLINTPVKTIRTVLSEMGQNTNVSNQENFQSMKKRLVEEQRLKLNVLNTRRTLILEEKSNNSSGISEIENSSNIASTSVKRERSPRKTSKRDNQKDNARKLVCGIERFFTVLPSEKRSK